MFDAFAQSLEERVLTERLKLGGDVLQRSTIFIALQNQTCALQRSAMWFGRPSYIPLLKERDRSGIWGYKHVAPPEQDPRYLDTMITTFGQSQSDTYACCKSLSKRARSTAPCWEFDLLL
jgi:hypothetical protein